MQPSLAMCRRDDADADGLIVGDDNFAFADENIVCIDVNIVVDIAVELNHGTAAKFEQLVDAQIRRAQCDRNFNADVFVGNAVFVHCWHFVYFSGYFVYLIISIFFNLQILYLHLLYIFYHQKYRCITGASLRRRIDSGFDDDRLRKRKNQKTVIN